MLPISHEMPSRSPETAVWHRSDDWCPLPLYLVPFKFFLFFVFFSKGSCHTFWLWLTNYFVDNRDLRLDVRDLLTSLVYSAVNLGCLWLVFQRRYTYSLASSAYCFSVLFWNSASKYTKVSGKTVVVYFVIFKMYMCFLKCSILEFYFCSMFIIQLRHHLSTHALSCVKWYLQKFQR